MSKRARYTVPIKKNQSFTLNITSMTDMFTILLVFLLQSYAAGEVNLETVNNLRLPTSVSDKNVIDGAKISVSKDKLYIDKSVLAEIKNNDVEKAALDENDPKFIKPLFEELKKFNQANEKLAKTGKVILQADESLPYSVLSKIMYTASMAGFPNLKLVTMSK